MTPEEAKALATEVVEKKSRSYVQAAQTLATFILSIEAQPEKATPMPGAASYDDAGYEPERRGLTPGATEPTEDDAKQLLADGARLQDAMAPMVRAVQGVARPDRDHPEDDYAAESDRMQEAAAPGSGAVAPAAQAMAIRLARFEAFTEALDAISDADDAEGAYATIRELRAAAKPKTTDAKGAAR